MKKNYKIAYIIPFYYKSDCNELFLSIQSIKDNNYDVDIFLCIDGPFDSFSHLINNVNIMYTNGPFGIAHTLNILLKKVSMGEYDLVFRLDADDQDRLNRISTIIEYYNKYPTIHLFCSNAIIQKFSTNKPSGILSFADFRYKNPIIHPSVVFTKRFFNEISFYDESFLKAQDLKLWLTLLSKGFYIYSINSALIDFNFNMDSVSRRSKSNSIYELKARKLYVNEIYPNYIIGITLIYLIKFVRSFNLISSFAYRILGFRF
jgi:hypothetical protein